MGMLLGSFGLSSPAERLAGCAGCSGYFHNSVTAAARALERELDGRPPLKRRKTQKGKKTAKRKAARKVAHRKAAPKRKR